MTLLAELKDPTRNYWIVPVSSTGWSGHPGFKLIHVAKRHNTPEVETWCEAKEREMIEILEATEGLENGTTK
jgi:hypothetical protein